MPETRRDRIAVVVTGVGGGGFGEQIPKALRLAETPCLLVGTDTTTMSKGFAAVDHGFVVPRADDSGYVEALLGDAPIPPIAVSGRFVRCQRSRPDPWQ